MIAYSDIVHLLHPPHGDVSKIESDTDGALKYSYRCRLNIYQNNFKLNITSYREMF